MKKYILLAFYFFCITLTAQQPTVKTFEIAGNKKTKASFVKKIVSLKEGAVLDSVQLAKDIDWITRLPSIAQANYKVIPESDNNYKVVYTIVENLTLIPTTSVWTANNDEFAFRLGLSEFNAFGQNISIGAFYQHDIYSSYGASVKAPFAFSQKWGFEVNAQNLVSEEPVFFENSMADFRYENASIEVLASYQLNFENNIRFGINVFNEFYQHKTGLLPDSIPEELEANKVAIKALYSYNNVKFEYYLLEGFQSHLNLQYVSGNDVNLPSFVIGWNDFLYYSRTGATGNWACRWRIGAATNDDTPFAPFAVDNNLNIRGVGNTIDRGSAAVVLNTEYRQTLFEKNWFVLQGNAFIDAGSWRKPGGSLSDLVSEETLRVFPGLGVRFIHKKIFNATFRIDYGYGLIDKPGSNSRGIVFGIGQYF